MDHILSTDEVDRYGTCIPEIPWLGYDHRPSQAFFDFDDYALQRGWSQKSLLDLKEGRLKELDQDSVKPFLQSWFSIGLCEAVLGRGLEKDSFIALKGPSTLFTSAPLRQFAADLEAKLMEGDDSDKEILERFIRILGAACLWNHKLANLELLNKENSDFCDKTYHSIMRMFNLLGLFLQGTGAYLAMYLPADSVVIGRYRSRLEMHWWCTNATQDGQAERMAQRGWCPYVRTMLGPFTHLVNEYAAIIGPPETHMGHRSCSPIECIRHNIDESTYKTLHTTPDCECQFVKPRLDRLADILDSGQIPLMDLNKIAVGDTGKVVNVIAFNSKKPASEKPAFNAISHVWSGGLGSVSEEGLPECMIELLGGYMESNAESKLVWIDSLCIPRDKRLRKLSIESISTVYREASATLVLDPELMRTSSSTTRQMLMWITSAAWMQRMWTLSEGRLSRSPYIVFKNAVILLDEILEDAREDYKNPIVDDLMNTLFGIFLRQGISLRLIHQSLCYRTTSKREDEAPALATLFGIDTGPILDAKSLDERMAMFWKSLSTKISLPMNIIFLRVPKLSIPGLRWAPSTLLNAGYQDSLLQPAEGETRYDVQLSDTGTLTGRYVVIRLTKRATLTHNTIIPIELAMDPDPGTTDMPLGSFTITSYKEELTPLQLSPNSLNGIDAFAVSVTKFGTTSARPLANELAGGVYSVVALTLDDDTEEQSSDLPASHKFIARDVFQMSQHKLPGSSLYGYVGWARISIS
ncbi:hypothetical protein EDD36DRAFT_476710 [Exophiala viscosa]|uniref:Heterokaryon incompatibility domain-containing protein n=1 Tax=Exophiala viscosa TaxID=2486360 RepID=A0AAN6DST6_9EURO|nr:hypothetical protein EDD36DRAFT_476710 [Exophiala viscosa]